VGLRQGSNRVTFSNQHESPVIVPTRLACRQECVFLGAERTNETCQNELLYIGTIQEGLVYHKYYILLY